jgi:hypothetical protein
MKRGLLTIFATASLFGIVPALKAQDGCLTLFDCVQDQPYHPVLKTRDGRYESAEGGEAVAGVTMYSNVRGRAVFRPDEIPSVARKVDFYKAYLEFDQDGRAFDPNQLRAILTKIAALKAQAHPVYVVTYVHGWHNNAQITGDRTADSVKFDNLIARYAELSRRLYEINGVNLAPVTVGIYIGWRGESMRTPLLNALTIGNRARAADRIALYQGSDGLQSALRQVAVKMRR